MILLLTTMEINFFDQKYTILIQRSSEDLHLNPTVLSNSHEKHSDS